MAHARRLIAILIGCAIWCIASTAVAHASMLHDPVPAPVPAGVPAVTSPGSGGTPLWQFLAFVALGALLAVAIGRLGNSLRHTQRSQAPAGSQQPLPH
jgi:prolipoprotein diacylglyceryltransferase